MKEFNALAGCITGYTKMKHFEEAQVNDEVIWIINSSKFSDNPSSHLSGIVKDVNAHGLDIHWSRDNISETLRKNVDFLYLKDNEEPKDEPIIESKLTIDVTVDATCAVSLVITEVLMKLLPVLIGSNHFKEAKELIDCLEALNGLNQV